MICQKQKHQKKKSAGIDLSYSVSLVDQSMFNIYW